MIGRTTLGLLSVLLVTGTVAADERTVPREPIGPGNFQMLPVQKSPLSADNIRIVNRGDQKLSFSYWDGQSAWKPQSIDSAASTDILCADCSGTFIVVYHDGTENRRVSLKGGGTYWLGWSTSRNAWLLTNPPN
jgi:hypothetical protein